MGEEEEDWEAIERAHNRELLTRLVLQIAATCLTVRAASLCPRRPCAKVACNL